MTGAAATLHGIVRALGGDLYQGGLRANVPAPGHSRSDRSISLMISGGRVVAHGFGATDWQAALDHLRDSGLIDARGQLRGGAAPGIGETPPRPERRAVALRLWDAARPIEAACLSARYLHARRVSADPGSILDIRHHPEAPVCVYQEGSATRAALIAAIREPSGGVSAVELTYLDPGGQRAVGLRLSRKTVGLVPPGSAVRLAPVRPELVVGEGVVTTLSAMARFDRPGWALLSVRNLAGWSPPAGVGQVIIAGDRGRPGETAALRLASRLRALGVGGRIAFPPPPLGDWNEAAPPCR